MPDPYVRTIAADAHHEIEIKKSRFLSTIARVATEADARARLEQIRKQHWDANHHCYAYVLGDRASTQKASDDGEPAGTAGVPILEVLKRREVTDTLAIVTRWFGGTKLGAGGLIRAYGQAVSETIDRVGIVERRPFDLVEVAVPYDDAGRIEHALRASPHPPVDITYAAEVRFLLHLDPADIAPFRAWLGELTSGAAHAEVTGRAFAEVPV